MASGFPGLLPVFSTLIPFSKCTRYNSSSTLCYIVFSFIWLPFIWLLTWISCLSVSLSCGSQSWIPNDLKKKKARRFCSTKGTTVMKLCPVSWKTPLTFWGEEYGLCHNKKIFFFFFFLPFSTNSNKMLARDHICSFSTNAMNQNSKFYYQLYLCILMFHAK